MGRVRGSELEEKRSKAALMADSVLALIRFSFARAEAVGKGVWVVVVVVREGRERLG